MNTVILRIRLPRICAAMLVGAGLAISGASFQGLFRNPLVSPSILGVAAGAGFGAALGILLSDSTVAVQALAFVFGIISVTATYMLQDRNHHTRPRPLRYHCGSILYRTHLPCKICGRSG